MYDRMPRSQRNKQSKYIRPYMRQKLALLFLIIVLALCGLAAVIVVRAFKTHEEYSRKALTQLSYQDTTIPAKSGNILDSNGNIIATSEKVYILILDPSVLYAAESLNEGTIDATIQAAVECFGLNEADLRKAFEENKDKAYVRFGGKTELTEAQVEAFEQKKEYMDDSKKNKSKARIRGIWFESEYRRKYPYNELASKIIGYTTQDTSQGLYGLEMQYNKELRGVNGRAYRYIGDEAEPERATIPAINGNTLRTTIDMNMERIIKDKVAEWLEQYGAYDVSVLAMNPQNGEILSFVSNTDYDLNNGANIQLSDFYSPEFLSSKTEDEKEELLYSGIYANAAITKTFEPGSTAKLLTIAAALEEKAITEDTTFSCHGFKQVANYKIKCHNFDKGGCSQVFGTEQISLEQVIEQSCNVALMDIAEKLGRTQFSRYQTIFNLAQKTGIDLPGEASAEGLLYEEEELNATELATNSFGQGYNVTMIQLASAFCSLINGGTYYQPHVVKQIVSPEGQIVKEFEPVKIRETVSKETSELIKRGCYRTVEEGTGGGTKIEGYHIGGKTGTAEKLPRGNGKYIVSIITAAPIEDPQIVLYVVIDEPNVENQADSYPAQQLAGWIWQDLVSYAGIFSDLEEGPEEVDPAQRDDSWTGGSSFIEEVK